MAHFSLTEIWISLPFEENAIFCAPAILNLRLSRNENRLSWFDLISFTSLPLAARVPNTACINFYDLCSGRILYLFGLRPLWRGGGSRGGGGGEII